MMNKIPTIGKAVYFKLTGWSSPEKVRVAGHFGDRVWLVTEDGFDYLLNTSEIQFFEEEEWIKEMLLDVIANDEDQLPESIADAVFENFDLTPKNPDNKD